MSDNKHVIIYIRHGHDKPSKKHLSDERLSSKGKKQARKMAKKLVKKYGMPDVIYTSPFRRTHSTAKAMKKELASPANGTPVELVVEPRIGRYFTSKERSRGAAKRISSSTDEKNPIMHEDWKEFKERVYQQMNELIYSVEALDKRKVIWNISHSLVLLEVANAYKVKRRDHVEYLDRVVLKAKIRSPTPAPKM